MTLDEITNALKTLQDAILSAQGEADAEQLDKALSMLRDLAIARKRYFAQVRMNRDSIDRAQQEINNADAKLLASFSEQS